ncbi:MAG: hypothetical protein AW11_03793 [Candidatus Accumulibacter regalis]|uniref:Uncharacterized protein n=1 Tax=Accumulibacter regalis TaxID=522306 RepID=A0A011Q629_ACCRE|nr:MAG: hypothetical protein AW11_03793 [Candidatus Accumulibacter regalis]
MGNHRVELLRLEAEIGQRLVVGAHHLGERFLAGLARVQKSTIEQALDEQRLGLAHRVPEVGAACVRFARRRAAVGRQVDRLLPVSIRRCQQRLDGQAVERVVRPESGIARPSLALPVEIGTLAQRLVHLRERRCAGRLPFRRRATGGEPSPRKDVGLALGGAAAQRTAFAIHRRAGRRAASQWREQGVETAQTFERAVDQRQRGVVPLVPLGLFVLFSQARLDIGQLLDIAYRHLPAAVVGLQCVEISVARLAELAEVSPHAGQRRLDRRQPQPACRAALVEQGVDAAQLRVELVPGLPLAAPRQRCTATGKLVEQFFGRGKVRCPAGAALQARLGQPTRLAVGLVSAPGNVFAIGLPDRFPRFEDRLPEGQSVEQQVLVERLAEDHRALVINRPAGDDHAAHADVDQLTRDAGRQQVAVLHGALGILRVAALAAAARIHLAQVAAAQENQFRHTFHGPYFSGRNQQTIGKDDPRATAAIDVLLVEDAVRRNMQQPVRLLVEPGQDVGRAAVAADLGDHLVGQTLQDRRHLVSLLLGARQWWRVGRVGPLWIRESGDEALDRRIADDEGLALESLAHLAAELHGRELPHDRGAQGQRQPFAGAALIVGEHQLPRQVGGVVVDHQDDAFELSRGVLEVVRHHQLEQHATEVLAPHRRLDLLAHEFLDQARLSLQNHRLGACALADVEKAQAFGDRRARPLRARRPSRRTGVAGRGQAGG